MVSEVVHYGRTRVVQSLWDKRPDAWTATACGRRRYAFQTPFQMTTVKEEVTCSLCSRSLKFKTGFYDSDNSDNSVKST